MTTETTVTADNIDLLREGIPCDQAGELRAGCITSPIYYGGNRGQLTIWPEDGRAAVALGGDSDWFDTRPMPLAAAFDGETLDLQGTLDLIRARCGSEGEAIYDNWSVLDRSETVWVLEDDQASRIFVVLGREAISVPAASDPVEEFIF